MEATIADENRLRSTSKTAERVLAAGFVALAVVPIVRMLVEIQGASRTQYNDYWFMINGTFRRDGWLDLGGLLTLRAEHPVLVPKVLYWGNARVFGGSNNTLGWIVALLVLVQLGILVSFLGPRVRLATRAAALLAMSALLFAPQGSWNFVNSMSGAAWLSANLAAIAAIALRTRGHRLAAVGLGVVASLSYSTGLMVWPALLVTGVARERRPRLEWPTVLGAAVTCLWYLDRYRGIDHAEPLDNSSFQPLRNAGELLGSLFTGGGPDVTRVVGWLMLAGAAVLSALALRKDASRAAPWTGLFAYAVGSAALIALGRNLLIGNFSASRYTSIGALLTIAALGQLLILVRRSVVHVAICVALAVAASLPGGAVIDDLHEDRPKQDLLAIALRLDVADGSLRWYAVFGVQFPEVTPVLKATGHYPFDGRFRYDCGLLGRRLPTDGADFGTPERVGSDSGRGRVLPARPMRGVPGAVQIVGRLGGPARCVVVTNRARRVIGMGVIGYQPARGPDSAPDAFTAIAPAGEDTYRVYAVSAQ